MANLRGGSFEKQIKNALYRLDAQGTGRHLQDDHLTHSNALWEKREMYLNDFKDFLQERGITEGKLNQYLTESIVKEFIEHRTADLHAKTALDYVSGVNSMLKGLQEVNVTIPMDLRADPFKELRENFRSELKELQTETGRYIENLSEKLQQIEEIRFESGVIAKIQAETGLRISEAFEVAKNFDKYYNEQSGMLEGVVGKGNHQYPPKEISQELAQKIQQIENIPHPNTYRSDLKEAGIDKSHDFRVTYAVDRLNEKISNGYDYKQALKEVSEEINHHRESMTTYYLNRA